MNKLVEVVIVLYRLWLCVPPDAVADLVERRLSVQKVGSSNRY